MRKSLIKHADLVAFAEQKVNLPADFVREYREQVNRLRDRLAAHIVENPGFALVKMLHAGSAAKGTALRTLNDLDLAVYVKKEKAPIRDEELVPWLAARLREANPNLKPEQFDDSSPHCVTVRFHGSGLDVDVVPVLYEGAENDIGYLIAKDTGDRLLTSVSRHLEFIRARKKAHAGHFTQVVRFVKWWAQQRKTKDPRFKCKSFLIELLVAHGADSGWDLPDYPRALEIFFSEIVRTGFEERISFTDYYPFSALPDPTEAAIEVFDPVNPSNNVAEKYGQADRETLVRAAEEAADAISEAHYATTKSRAVECWQSVFGPTFRG